MANDVTGFQIQAYDRRVQRLLERRLVSKPLASMAIAGGLVKGTTVKRPRHEDVYVDDYTKYTDVTFQDFESSQETLTIDQSKIVSFRLDEVDKIQSDFSIEMKYADRSSFRLANEMDARFFDEIVDADYDIDDGDIGGTSGVPIALSTSNVIQAFSAAFSELQGNDVQENTIAVVDPKTAWTIAQAAINVGFNLADSTFKNGYAGDFLGASFYVSNNLRSNVTLSMATQPTAGDTVVIHGVTFTFRAVPALAGEVDLGADVDATRVNLTAAVNGTGTPSATTYIALSAANRRKLKNKRIVATDSPSGNTMALVYSGRMVVSETFTDATDAWGNQTVNSMIGTKGIVDMVIQKNVNTTQTQEPKQLVKNYMTHTLYGLETYTEGQEKMLNLKIKV